jgi:HlyD family secretion protein
MRPKRLLSWSVAALVVAALAWLGLRPAPVPVEVAPITRGPLRVTIDEEGETRVSERFVVSAPVSGQVLRIDLEPGDPVVARQTVVATFRPALPNPLDARARAEAESRVKVARAALERAQAIRDQARTEQQLAEADLQRQQELNAARLLPVERLDAAVANAQARTEAARAAESAVRAAQFELEAAQAVLIGGAAAVQRPRTAVTIRAPAGGVVLRRLRESEAVVAAGEPLLEIGDLGNLEVVADLLSTDAVRVSSGQPVQITGWGGTQAIKGVVRRVEPSAFTKVSALGVEEQRVNVIVAFDDPGAASKVLGDGYRVEVQIVSWEQPDVVKVPIGALFRVDDDWAAFVVAGNRAAERRVTIGHRNAVEAEVVSGLDTGDVVVVHPSDRVMDGTRVTTR